MDNTFLFLWPDKEVESGRIKACLLNPDYALGIIR